MPTSANLCAALATVATLVALTGCGTEPSPAAVPAPPARPALLPARPADLRSDQVEVCSLLTTEQRTQLKVDAFGSFDNDTRVCDWRVGHSAQSYGWLGRFDRPNQAESAARGAGAQVVQIGGFPAVQTSSAGFDPNYGCIYVIDIAADQEFSVAYFNDRKDIPGMNRQKACQQAATVAELTLANLKARAR